MANSPPSAGLVIHAPGDPASRLLLLFHGVGGAPEQMVPIGRRLMRAFPDAAIVSVPGREAADAAHHRQWFSVAGVTDENRPPRVAAAMPAFFAAVAAWQQQAAVAPGDTVLLGFSQGALMALESTQRDGPPLAGRIVALSGRFATAPRTAPAHATVHLLHGERDAVMPARHAIEAAERLTALGGRVTLDLFPTLAHEISAEVAERVIERLG